MLNLFMDWHTGTSGCILVNIYTNYNLIFSLEGKLSEPQTSEFLPEISGSPLTYNKYLFD